MNAITVFEERKEDFRAQLDAAADEKARIAAAQFALEQIACVLAQQEQDDIARQRQQAVLAVARRAPELLACAGAEGELVLAPAKKKKKPVRAAYGAKAIGAAILALLAAYELIDGQFIFAALQAAGMALLLLGGGALPARFGAAGAAQARGIVTIDADALLARVGDLCRAADVCVSDLSLLEKEAGLSRLSGTADEAMIDLLMAMMEAKASGRADAGERMLSLAEQYLRMLGMEAVMYSRDTEDCFDVLPTLTGERTIRPALFKDGKLIRRGVAARAMEGSVGA